MAVLRYRGGHFSGGAELSPRRVVNLAIALRREDRWLLISPKFLSRRVERRGTFLRDGASLGGDRGLGSRDWDLGWQKQG